MEIKRIGLLVFCCFYFLYGFTQSSQSVYIELGGPSLFSTINYDINFLPKEKGRNPGQYGFRLGVGISPKYRQDSFPFLKTKHTNGMAMLVVAGAYYLADFSYSGAADYFIEIGPNLTYAGKNSIAEKFGDFKDKFRLIPSLDIGIRTQSQVSRSFMWRLCYTPYYLDEKLRHFGGISLGYNFQ